jgi:hypothetical protein
MENESITLAQLAEVVKNIEPMQFLGFTFSRKGWEAIRPQISHDLLDVKGLAFGVPFYVVETQRADVIEWRDRVEMEQYVAGSSILHKHFQERKYDHG